VDFAGFFEQVAEVIGHGTYEVNGYFFVVFVFPDMDIDEFAESVVDEFTHPFFVAMIAQKTHERGQIHVGIGLVVNGFEDAFFGEIESLDQAIVDFFGEFVVEEHAKKVFAVEGSTGFIAQDVTQGRDFLVDFFAIEIAAIRAGTQDTRDAGVIATSCIYRASEVMVNHYIGFGENGAQCIFYDDISGGVTCTGAIEKHMLYHWGNRTEFRIFSDLTFD
jgi:hypothetical protein